MYSYIRRQLAQPHFCFFYLQTVWGIVWITMIAASWHDNFGEVVIFIVMFGTAVVPCIAVGLFPFAKLTMYALYTSIVITHLGLCYETVWNEKISSDPDIMFVHVSAAFLGFGSVWLVAGRIEDRIAIRIGLFFITSSAFSLAMSDVFSAPSQRNMTTVRYDMIIFVVTVASGVLGFLKYASEATERQTPNDVGALSSSAVPIEVQATLQGRRTLAWHTGPMDMSDSSAVDPSDNLNISGIAEPADSNNSGDETSMTVDLDIDVSSFRHIPNSHFRHRGELPMAQALADDEQQILGLDDIIIFSQNEVPQASDGMEPYRLSVCMMTGNVVEINTCDVSIGEIKERILVKCGVEPHLQQLSLDSRSNPAQDSEMLHELVALGSRSLSLHLTVTDYESFPGPFSIGQDHTWGVWEGMSNSSGILDVYQGKWKAPTALKQRMLAIWHDKRYLSIKVNGDTAKDKLGNQIPMNVHNGRVFLWGMLSICRQCTRPPNVGKTVLQVMNEANRCVLFFVRCDRF